MPEDRRGRANPVKFDGPLTVVIPAYNEAERIENTLETVFRTLSVFSDRFEIIVVDDGSDDDTRMRVRHAQSVNPHIRCVCSKQNQGKGNALKLGVLNAEREGYIAFLDADLDLHPKHIPAFYRVMQSQKADVVIGSKMHPESKLEYPESRRRISFCYFCVLKVLFGLNVHDTQTGVKLFRANKIKEVMPYILVKRYAYDIEVLALLNRNRARIVEAPIELCFQRGTAWSRIRLKDVFQTGWDTLAVFYRLHILHYYDRAMREAQVPESNPNIKEHGTIEHVN